jgi:hypothetical protein
MNIALDYDGTFTAAPEQWLEFIKMMQRAGHGVCIVTMRYPSECDGTKGSVDSRLKELFVPFICTSRTAKQPFCESLGIMIHIWIDDHPEAVHNDATTIWNQPSPEGSVIIPVHD